MENGAIGPIGQLQVRLAALLQSWGWGSAVTPHHLQVESRALVPPSKPRRPMDPLATESCTLIITKDTLDY